MSHVEKSIVCTGIINFLGSGSLQNISSGLFHAACGKLELYLFRWVHSCWGGGDYTIIRRRMLHTCI